MAGTDGTAEAAGNRAAATLMKNSGVSVLYDLIIDETEESEECMP